jgi:putative sigma-54 modulation protein
MKLNITARHFDLTPQLKENIERELDGLTKFFDNIISADVILDVEKYRQSVEIKIKVYNQSITAKADSNDMYASLEKAIDKVKVQLKKYKGKLKEKHPEKIEANVAKTTRPKTNDEEVDV